MAIIPGAPDVAGIVKQGGGSARQSQLRAQRPGRTRVLLVAIKQTHHGQGDIQHVLDIVVLDLAGAEAGEIPLIKPGKILDQAVHH